MEKRLNDLNKAEKTGNSAFNGCAGLTKVPDAYKFFLNIFNRQFMLLFATGGYNV